MTALIDLDDVIQQARVSLSQARKHNDTDLYVLNTCDINGSKQKGDLKLKIFQEGKYIKVTVPDTWIPWEITKYTTRAVWLKDPVFANLIDKGAITIIDSKVAREILELEEAEEEQRKLLDREQQYENGFRSTEQNNQRLIEAENDRQKMRDAVDNNSGRNKSPTVARKPSKIVLNASDAEEEKTSTNIRLVAIMNNKELNEVSKLNAIIKIKNELSLSDYDYIMNRLSSKETRIKDWVVRSKR